jgi:hypothetical protein
VVRAGKHVSTKHCVHRCDWQGASEIKAQD